ncbi:MAG: hypothetical protein MJY82_00260 [Fibrobacter sp.]|nr:hypothetical protein [Fibrobacter sp.]
MKKIIILIAFLSAFVFAEGGAAANKNMGAGIWLQAGNPGEHVGLDFQMRMDETTVIDIYGHFYFSSGDNSLGAYFGYYWNLYLPSVPDKLGRMGFYIGPVGGIGWWEESFRNWDYGGFAIRFGVTGGYQWEFPVIPLQLYLELNPVGEFHYLWWDRELLRADEDDDDVEWEIPDFYFRIGLRFWF